MIFKGVWLIFSLTVAYLCSAIEIHDYCQIGKNCTKGKHIACHPEQMLEKAKLLKKEISTNWTAVPMTKKLRRAILSAHNEDRNDIACGNGTVKDKDGKFYPAAVRMREVMWDDELEYIAARHSEQCVFSHDDCRISSRYRYTGQNLAMKRTRAKYISVLEDVVGFVHAWYHEYKDASVREVDSVGSTGGKKKIGHFSVMVNERVTKIGCALTKCWLKGKGKNRPHMHLFTCNYSYTNMIGMRMYTGGYEAASMCDEVKSVKSDKYKCLCSHSDYQL